MNFLKNCNIYFVRQTQTNDEEYVHSAALACPA